MLSPNTREPFKRRLSTHCEWCVCTGPKRNFYKLRDGPVDWYFCEMAHAELWLHYRYDKRTHDLCRMGLQERRAYLAGTTMEKAISRRTA